MNQHDDDKDQTPENAPNKVPGSPFPDSAPINRELWRKFVERPAPEKPAVPTPEKYAAMSEDQRRASRRERKNYHAAFGPIEVISMQQIHEAFLRMAFNNLRAGPGARPGGIIDGQPTLGKSTIMMQLGRKYERIIRKEYPIEIAREGHAFIPVIYISLPSDTTIKSFNSAWADFLGIPTPKSVRAEFLTRQIIRYAQLCGTSLVLIDDIHYLKLKNRTGETVNNHLKHLANTIPATFVYAGVGCEATSLLNEGATGTQVVFAQTQKRFKKFDLYPYSLTTASASESWLTLLQAFDDHLCLVNHAPGSLKRLAKYIFKRTRGFIGPLSALITEGANLAIDNKTEEITRDLLNQVILDYDSEKRYRRK